MDHIKARNGKNKGDNLVETLIFWGSDNEVEDNHVDYGNDDDDNDGSSSDKDDDDKTVDQEV